MGQLFQRGANTIAVATVLGGGLAVAGTCACLFAAGRSDFWTRVRAPMVQPVPFSHEHHVSGLGIDCRYCHSSVEKSAFAGIPSTETCMTCHSQIWKDAPVLAPVRESLQSGQSLRWLRIHDLPDYVYFDHSIHLTKGIGCATCHGRVDQMPMTMAVQPLYMRWCLDCHRAPEKQIRPREQVFNMSYGLPPNQREFGRELATRNQIRHEGLTDCYTCHR